MEAAWGCGTHQEHSLELVLVEQGQAVGVGWIRGFPLCPTQSRSEFLEKVPPVEHYLSSPSSTSLVPFIHAGITSHSMCHCVVLIAIYCKAHVLFYNCMFLFLWCDQERRQVFFYRDDCKVKYGQQEITEGHIFRRNIFIQYMSDMSSLRD